MSWFTSLRDSVITPSLVSSVNSATGLNLQTSSTASSAAPSGAVGLGGVPNQNPGIFSSVGTNTYSCFACFIPAQKMSNEKIFNRRSSFSGVFFN